jgi:hypothetical protein
VITQSELHELVNYDPETGVFTWRSDRFAGAYKQKLNARAGDVAGAFNTRGYWVIRNYTAHRLAWLYMTGKWPEADIDHINGDRADNRWSNLRAATRAENLRNVRLRESNKLGLKGVYWQKDKRKYIARIQVNGKVTCLGRFNCPTAAHLAYCRAAKKFHGEFARVA